MSLNEDKPETEDNLLNYEINFHASLSAANLQCAISTFITYLLRIKDTTNITYASYVDAYMSIKPIHPPDYYADPFKYDNK